MAVADFNASVSIALGDVVTLPDGRALSVRSVVELRRPVCSIGGFWLLGELEMVVSTPARDDQPHDIYLPIRRFPVDARHASTVAEGSARFWAPHLPALGGAMGEILYRVVEVRGSVDPVIVVYRGPEAVVFVKTSFAWGSDLDVLHMERGADESPVDRHTAEVLVPSSAAVVTADMFSSLTRR